MAQIVRGRVRDTTTTTGTTAKVVSGSALLGYRTFSAVMAVGDTIWCACVNQTVNEWEVALYQYTALNTLTVVNVLDSTAGIGNAVAFSAGTKDIFAIGPVQMTSFSVQPPAGRLTALSGTPVMTSSVTASTSVFYTPYTGQTIPLYDGNFFHNEDFGAGGLSQLLTDTTKSPAAAIASAVYDMFVWNDAGTLRCTRGPAWTNTTTRSLLIARTGAFFLNSSAITNGPAASRGTYVGTIFTNASGTLDYILGGNAAGGVKGYLGVWNAFNRVDVGCLVRDATSSWTYGNAAWRNANNSLNNAVSYVCGLSEEMVEADYSVLAQPVTTGSAIFGTAGIGIDSATALAANCTSSGSTVSAGATTAGYFAEVSTYTGYPGIGAHAIWALEYATGAGVSFFGGSGGGGVPQGLRFRFRM
jgi:hypothetical protein